MLLTFAAFMLFLKEKKNPKKTLNILALFIPFFPQQYLLRHIWNSKLFLYTLRREFWYWSMSDSVRMCYVIKITSFHTYSMVTVICKAVWMYVSVCVRACVRACVRVCVWNAHNISKSMCYHLEISDNIFLNRLKFVIAHTQTFFNFYLFTYLIHKGVIRTAQFCITGQIWLILFTEAKIRLASVKSMGPKWSTTQDFIEAKIRSSCVKSLGPKWPTT